MFTVNLDGYYYTRGNTLWLHTHEGWSKDICLAFKFPTLEDATYIAKKIHFYFHRDDDVVTICDENGNPV